MRLYPSTMEEMNNLCAICGVRPATTKDHVPPKNLFPKPRPQDLVTVPACICCNNGSSVEDEDFRTYLSLQIGKQTDLMGKLWLQSRKSLERRTQMRMAFLESIKSLGSTYQPKAAGRIAFEIPERVYVTVFERVVRGLYYHHFDEILGKEVAVSVAPLTGIDDISFQSIENWPTYSIGGNAFVYKVSRASDSPKSTAWVLQLYESHWILCETDDVINI